MPQYIVRKLKIGKTSQLNELARAEERIVFQNSC